MRVGIVGVGSRGSYALTRLAVMPCVDVTAFCDIDEAAMKPVPVVASDGTSGFITNVITLEDGRMLRRLDLGTVLPGKDSEAA